MIPKSGLQGSESGFPEHSNIVQRHVSPGSEDTVQPVTEVLDQKIESEGEPS
jgi:hypothetical protein